MPFSQILAQDAPISVLRRSITLEQVGHAYLFFGPESIGKRMTALAFAKALNCTDEGARAQGDYCDVCCSCRMIDLGQHPDVRLLTPETTGGKTVIPIDAIRTKIGESSSHPLPLREDAQLIPLEGRRKVYIIDPANRPGFQEEAGNALLLLLEEPPPYVTIILISSRPSAVLTTLVSRCQPLRFHLAARDTILRALPAGEGTETDSAMAIAGMAAGRIGWAFSALAHPRVLEVRSALFTEIDHLFSAGRPAALRLSEQIQLLASADDLIPEAEEEDAKARVSADRLLRRNLPDLLDMVASWWRDLLVTELQQPAMRINRDFADMFDRHRGQTTAERLRQSLQAIMQTKRLLERNANIDLALERLCMTILSAR
jgi:DNA polymerase-3 subunit delta'